MVNQMNSETKKNQTNSQVSGICFISLPRTGTTYLSSLISHFKEIDPFSEIFHKKRVHIRNIGNKNITEIIHDINHEYDLQISSVEDTAFVDFVHQNPEYLLELIRLNSDKKYFSFKIFDGHLTRNQLKSHIINNIKLKKIIIKRNLLNVYISLQIAKKLQTWAKVNTSDLCIDFDEEHFLNWYRKKEKFYDFLKAKMIDTQQEIVYLEYEKLHQLQSDIEKFKFIFNMFKQLNLEISQDNLDNLEQKLSSQNTKIFKKQDQREGVLHKVNNPEELKLTLKKFNLEHLIN